MAGAIGADVEQLRSLAKQFTTSADRLQQSSSGLSGAITNAAFWRGNDADQFRAQWRSQSTPSITNVVKVLRSAADALGRNADEQDQASAAGTAAAAGAAGSSSTGEVPKEWSRPPADTNDLWKALKHVEHIDDSSGYHVQKITKGGKTRYIVYIGGTLGSDGQGVLANAPSAKGTLDQAQVDRLKKLIDPPGSEVMLVGYSQGGMDAQNIAKDTDLNVKQIVTFGSPARSDLDVPAVHLRANWDPVPGSTTTAAGGATILGGLLGGPAGAARGAVIGGNAYWDSEFKVGANNGYFDAPAGFNSLNPMDFHADPRSYSNVSNEFDAAMKNGTAGKAGEMGKNIADFMGGSTDGEWDIDTSGTAHDRW